MLTSTTKGQARRKIIISSSPKRQFQDTIKIWVSPHICWNKRNTAHILKATTQTNSEWDTCQNPDLLYEIHIDGLLQERRNSIANALELSLSCINPSIWSIETIYILLQPLKFPDRIIQFRGSCREAALNCRLFHPPTTETMISETSIPNSVLDESQHWCSVTLTWLRKYC